MTLPERSFRLSVGLNLTIADWGGVVKLGVLKFGDSTPTLRNAGHRVLTYTLPGKSYAALRLLCKTWDYRTFSVIILDIYIR